MILAVLKLKYQVEYNEAAGRESVTVARLRPNALLNN